MIPVCMEFMHVLLQRPVRVRQGSFLVSTVIQFSRVQIWPETPRGMQLHAVLRPSPLDSLGTAWLLIQGRHPAKPSAQTGSSTPQMHL
jgi:hypothetical protein